MTVDKKNHRHMTKPNLTMVDGKKLLGATMAMAAVSKDSRNNSEEENNEEGK